MIVLGLRSAEDFMKNTILDNYFYKIYIDYFKHAYHEFMTDLRQPVDEKIQKS